VERTTYDSPETKAILRRMEEVRCNLDEGAQEIAESARDLTEWRHYVKRYPLTCLGTACAIGYAIVPRRRLELQKVNQTLGELADQSRLLKTSQSPPTASLRTSVLMFAGNLLWRSALSYAARQATQYFSEKSVASTLEERP
jgi:hypothetical protein